MRPLPRSTAPLGALLAFAAATLSRSGLPLEHLPGPGSALLFTDLARGTHALGWSSALLAPLYGLLGLAPLAACLGPVCAGMAALGLGLLVEALLPPDRPVGPVGAWTAALVGAWAPALTLSWMFGPDLPAWGLSWLGIGVTAAASRRGALGVAALGVATLELGLACKATALPLLAAALALPWTAPAGRRRARALELLALAALPLPVLIFALDNHQPYLAGAALDAAEPGEGPWAVLPGWSATFELAARGHPQGIVPLLAGLAALGLAAAPFGRARFALGIAALVGVELTGGALGTALQPRYLLSAAAPLLALTAALPAAVPRRRWALRAALSLAIVLPFAIDSLVAREAWRDSLQALFDAPPAHRAAGAPSRRPRMRDLRPKSAPPRWTSALPTAIAGRYTTINRGELMDITDPGTPELMQLAAAVGRPQVMALSVRDRRELHGRLAAEGAGARWRTVSCERCCPNGCGPACAARLETSLRASSAALLVPIGDEGLKGDDKALLEAIYTQTTPRPGDFSGLHWHVLLGQGAAEFSACRSSEP